MKNTKMAQNFYDITPEELAHGLRNIGPQTARCLLDVGIDSLEKLQAIGAEQAYFMLIESPNYCSPDRYHAAYLYALEGAIQEKDWRLIDPEKKRYYKELTAQLRYQAKLSKPDSGKMA